MEIDLKKLNLRKTVSIERPKNELFLFFKTIKLNAAHSSKPLQDKKKERFYSDLSVLLMSGIDIKTALEIIMEDQENNKEKALFSGIYNTILNGDSLSEAIRKTNKFSDYDYYSIKIGEETGKVAEVLKDLNLFYNRKIKQNKKLVSAFSYPVLVLIIAILAVVFMLTFMVPMFEDIFKRSNKELPKLTQFIVDLSDFVSQGLGYFILLVTVIGVFIYSIRNKEYFRKYSSRLLLRLPIIGNIFKMIYLEKFFQSMALLTSSKVTMLRSVQLVRKFIGFYSFEAALAIIEQDLFKGASLHESMSKFHFFDKRITSLVKVGEEVNQLDKIFEKLNLQYAEELEHLISMMGSLLEPVLIIFIGLLVAVVLIAMYLPMFQMGSTIY